MERKATIAEKINKMIVSTEKATSIEVVNPQGDVIAHVKSDNMAPEETFYVDPGDYTIVSDGKIEDIQLEYEKLDSMFEMASLSLSTDAKDFHKVDGVPEILADGNSFATIFIEKKDSIGKPLNRVKDNEELFIRTTAGSVKDNKGKKEIRSVQLSKGKASFRLYSETVKRLATVQVISADPMLEDTSINIEFF